MNKTTLKALENSIEHWENNLISETPLRGAEHCGLCIRFPTRCKRFDDNDKTQVEICPVREKTGYLYCVGSPYSYIQWNDKKSIQNEIDFLNSLLPDNNG